MASSDPKNVYVDSGKRLSDKVQNNVSSLGSLCRQAVKSSKCNEILAQSARSFAMQEHSIHNTEQNLVKIHQLVANLQFHTDSMQRNAHELPTINTQLDRIATLASTER